MSKPTMNTQDAVSANFAECFVTIDGTRYSMLMAKEFEGTASVNTAEVYKLGGVVVGHKAQTVVLSFSISSTSRLACTSAALAAWICAVSTARPEARWTCSKALRVVLSAVLIFLSTPLIPSLRTI